MQEDKMGGLVVVIKEQQFLSMLRNRVFLLLMVLSLAGILFTDTSCTGYAVSSSLGAAGGTVVINGASRWEDDNTVTRPTADFSLPDPQANSVSPLFAQYYNSKGGTTSLGNPLTVAFPNSRGWLQFFTSGALLLPSTQPVRDSDNSLAGIIDSGVKDRATGVVRLSLLQALLTAGSQAPIGGEGSPLTYSDLRKATRPDLLVPPPVNDKTAVPFSEQIVFIKGGTRAGKDVGHSIPQTFWNYIKRTDISPDGWQVDFGPPLTEALPFSLKKDGSVHQMLVQVFLRDALIEDQSTQDATGQETIQRLNTGMDYLQTAGFPSVMVNAWQAVWSQGETSLIDAPGTNHLVAHIGQNFPLTLLGDARWQTDTLWYHIQWTGPKRSSSGWVAANAITFTSPGKVPGWASMDVIDPNLANYLTNIGSNAGVMVYDLMHQRYYSSNANSQFIMGSSMKVPIMLTFLNMVEQQGREPTDDEMNLLTTMIENSNNDSASSLYYGEIGSAAGVAQYMQSIGITGFTPDPDAWGYSVITPQSMVTLLTDLHDGKILSAPHRSLALSLMNNIEPDQQVGVGDTAPNGSIVAMKDGWLTGPDDLWDMNSSGIVTQGQETYIISVYTQGQSSLDDGQAIARSICSSVASQFK